MDLAEGRIPVTLTYEKGSALRPANGAYPFGLGPVVIEPVAETKVFEVPGSDADRFCGKSLDWLEVLAAQRS